MAQPRKRGDKKRHPRITIPASVHTDWRDKLHPFFLRMAEYNKKVSTLLVSLNEADRAEGQRLNDNPPPELRREAKRMHKKIKDRARNEAFLLILGVHPSQQGTTISERQYMLGWFARNKYGKSIFELRAGDEVGDEKSSKQLASVVHEYQRWRYGKSDPNELRFKCDHQHAPLMLLGLDLGLLSLTPGELADCFDALSVCECKDTHSAENLDKLRKRLTKDIARLTPNPPGQRTPSPKGRTSVFKQSTQQNLRI